MRIAYRVLRIFHPRINTNFRNYIHSLVLAYFYLFTLNLFRDVSADTKTCGSPLNPAPTGDLRLPHGKHTSILTEFQTKVNKKTVKNYQNFWPP